MSLLRTAARTMLASFFVLNGVKTVKEPHDLVPATQPLADAIVPLVQNAAPEQIARYIPTDTVTLVRIQGIAQVVGGIALATGKARRAGALVLAGSLVPQTVAHYAFWSEKDPEHKSAKREQFAKNLALAGAALLAAQDTEGKPSLAWRAQAGTERGRKSVQRGAKRAKKDAKALARAAQREGELRAKDLHLGLK
ncbi:MAG TPA: DoxX family protein [Candidatus Avipropionibacterium avicola]|uniref:DoxX family protein n=1 Tax=Candidatus Avipropionibacterium avicola TaxID=2840701 RepID=A0A9D1GV93_9ACTN|nr:DoxX family protein [Candidatus Avipropionibacterium avicola]